MYVLVLSDFLEFKMKIFVNFKKHKYALISETKFRDQIYYPWSQHNILKLFQKVGK